MELDTEVRLSQRRKYLPQGALERFSDYFGEVSRMLRALKASLERHQASESR